MYEEHSTLRHEGRIDSWKAIAAFLGRDERTVQRWEKERFLPVHRASGERGTVFAYRRELLRWLHDAPASSPVHRVTVHLPRPETHLARRASQTLTSRDPAYSNERPPQVQAPAAGGRWLFWVAAGAFALLLFVADSYHARVQAAPSPETIPLLGASGFSASGLGASGLSTAGLSVSGGAEAVLSRRPGSAVEEREQAREFYLRGRYFWNRRTGDSLERARDEFMQAIVHDASYAEAYAGLAATYELMPQYSPTPVSEAFPRGLAAARRAVALQPSSAEAHRVLGFGLFYWEWKAPAAFAELHRAMELDPTDAEAHHWYATALLTLRRPAEARAEIQRARELNPTSRAILADGILIDSAAGANATECLKRLRELEGTEPDFLSPSRYLAEILFDRKDYGGWIAELKKTADRSQSPSDLALARAAARGWQHGGERGMFLELRKAQQGIFDEGKTSGYDLALTCLQLGDRDAAMQYLQAAYAAHDFRLLSLVRDPDGARLQGFAPYEALRQAVEGRSTQPV